MLPQLPRTRVRPTLDRIHRASVGRGRVLVVDGGESWGKSRGSIHSRGPAGPPDMCMQAPPPRPRPICAGGAHRTGKCAPRGKLSFFIPPLGLGALAVPLTVRFIDRRAGCSCSWASATFDSHRGLASQLDWIRVDSSSHGLWRHPHWQPRRRRLARTATSRCCCSRAPASRTRACPGIPKGNLSGGWRGAGGVLCVLDVRTPTEAWHTVRYELQVEIRSARPDSFLQRRKPTTCLDSLGPLDRRP